MLPHRWMPLIARAEIHKNHSTSDTRGGYVASIRINKGSLGASMRARGGGTRGEMLTLTWSSDSTHERPPSSHWSAQKWDQKTPLEKHQKRGGCARVLGMNHSPRRGVLRRGFSWAPWRRDARDWEEESPGDASGRMGSRERNEP